MTENRDGARCSAHTCDPGIQEAEAGGPLQVQGQLGLPSEMLSQKNTKQTNWEATSGPHGWHKVVRQGFSWIRGESLQDWRPSKHLGCKIVTA